MHQVRYTTKFVNYKDLKPFVKDLKEVYQASTEEPALENLDQFEEKWGAWLDAYFETSIFLYFKNKNPCTRLTASTWVSTLLHITFYHLAASASAMSFCISTTACLDASA